MSKSYKNELRRMLEEILSKYDSPPYIPDYQDFDPSRDRVFYAGPVWNSDEIAAIIRTVLTGRWLSSGNMVSKFENEFAKKFNQAKAVMVNSGSSANLVMISALKKYYNWQDGDEVIVSAAGFPTTVNPIVQNNLKPIFVDISWKDVNWDIEEIAKKAGPNTRALFSSPVMGNPYDIDKVVDLCKADDLVLIGDNCDSLGSKWKGKYLSDYFVASSYSFYPAHHITTGEGGMVSSNEPKIIKIARSMAYWGRDCYCVGTANWLPKGTCGNRFDYWLEGIDYIVDHKYVFSNMGYNLKPMDFQGAIGLAQLEKFEDFHRKRRSNKLRIHRILEKNIQGIRVINALPEAETSWFGVLVICENSKIKARLVDYLEKNRIQTRNYFAGNILIHPVYRDLDDFKDYPLANRVLRQIFFIGCSPSYSWKVFEYIDEVTKGFDNNHL